MLTVKDAVKLLPGADEYQVSYSGFLHDYDASNEMICAAYGDFLVDRVEVSRMENGELFGGKLIYELHIAVMPLKKGYQP